MPSLAQRGLLFGLAVALLAWAGCELPSSKPRRLAGGSLLPPITPPRDAIRLELVFIERPIGDALLGETLWRDVDQIGAVALETRTALARNGLRIGHVGASGPAALAELLNPQTDGRRDAPRVQPLTVRPGHETVVHVGQVWSRLGLELRTTGAPRRHDFDQARCVFRLTPHRQQDGWIELEVLPEIHHDDVRPRPTAFDEDWQYRTRAKIERLFPLRFTLHLSLGELALITSDAQPGPSVGRVFFVGADESAGTQRLLAIRLADMRRVDAVFAE